MGGIDWRRARQPKETEDAIGEGFVRNDGRVTPVLPKNSLAKRAAAAERKWLADNGLEVVRGGYIAKTKPGKRR